MAYSAMTVANAFIKRAKEGRLRNLTPMKLQKLLYFLQSWHLVRNDEPLINDTFHRWTYGPVIPSLYYEFKEYGAQPIATYGGHLAMRDGAYTRVRTIVGDSDEDTWNLIDEIIRVYGDYSGAQLSAMTHTADSAWCVSGPDDGGAIPEESMKQCILNSPHFSQGQTANE